MIDAAALHRAADEAWADIQAGTLVSREIAAAAPQFVRETNLWALPDKGEGPFPLEPRSVGYGVLLGWYLHKDLN
jgi:hypothetical protein